MEAPTHNSPAVSLPRLGQPAPPFQAESTHGTIRLEDFKGNWLILFSHPADFTPVCTTEFIEFAKLHPEFKRRNVELLGLSIDSTYSHIAWVRNIEAHFKVSILFPVIADLNKEVATLYGMVMPGESKTETSRCVFIIDPNQIVRAMIYYPLTTGRNMDEILRVIDALQTTDKHGVATPANWRPGEKVILPSPKTVEGAAERLQGRLRLCRLVFLQERSSEVRGYYKDPFFPRLLKEVQIQGATRSEARDVLTAYVAAPRERGNAARWAFFSSLVGGARALRKARRHHRAHGAGYSPCPADTSHRRGSVRVPSPSPLPRTEHSQRIAGGEPGDRDCRRVRPHGRGRGAREAIGVTGTAS